MGLRTTIDLSTSGTIDLTEDFSIALTYSIADIRNPDKRNASYSKTVTIPGTKNNNILFTHLYEIDIYNGFNPNIKTPCVVKVDSIPILEGSIQLLKINISEKHLISYECCIIGNMANIFTEMANDELTSLDFSAYNHTYDLATQEANFTSSNTFYSSGYCYPMIDYGKTNLLAWDVTDFYPALFVKEILDKIFTYCGFTYTSNFLTSDLFKRLIIPSNGENFRLTDHESLIRLFKAGLSLADQTFGQLYFQRILFNDVTPPYYDYLSQFNYPTYEWVVAKTGWYNVNAVIKYHPRYGMSSGTSATVNFGGTTNSIFRVVNNQSIGGVSVLASNSDAYHHQDEINPGFSSWGVTLGQNGPSHTATVTANNVLLTAGDRISIDMLVGTDADGANDVKNVLSNITTVIDRDYTYFYNEVVNTQITYGDTVNMNNAIPEKVKMRDFFTSIIKMFNLYVEIDKNNDKNLLIEPRNDFYSSGTTKDWTSKFDLIHGWEIQPMGLLEAGEYDFQYKEDSDYYNTLYKKKYNENYGTYKKIVTNDYLKDKKETELIFSPTPLVNEGTNDRTIPRIVAIDSSGNLSKVRHGLRILYWGGLKSTSNPWGHWSQNLGPSTFITKTNFPYAGHLDDYLNPTIDLSFGIPKEVYYQTSIYTNNNLYNKYYKKFISEITDKDSKVVTGYFYLTPKDIAELDFRNVFFVDGHYFTLNKIYDYNPVIPSLTKCEFVKINETSAFTAVSGTIYGGIDAVIGGDDAPIIGYRVMSGNNSYNPDVNKVTGYNNILSRKALNVVVSGDNNNIHDNSYGVQLINSSGSTVYSGCKNISLINSSGCTINAGVKSVVLINSSGVIVDFADSGTIYMGNQKIRTNDTSSQPAGIYYTSGVISSAEYLNIATTFKTIVPAKGTGTYINVLSYSCRMNHGGVTYNDGGDSNDYLHYGGTSFGNYLAYVDGLVSASSTKHYKFDLKTSALLLENTELCHARFTPPTTGNGTITYSLTYEIIRF